MALLIQEQVCESCEETAEICHTCGRCSPHCPCDYSQRDFDSEYLALVELRDAQQVRTKVIMDQLDSEYDKTLAETLERVV